MTLKSTIQYKLKKSLIPISVLFLFSESCDLIKEPSSFTFVPMIDNIYTSCSEVTKLSDCDYAKYSSCFVFKTPTGQKCREKASVTLAECEQYSGPNILACGKTLPCQPNYYDNKRCVNYENKESVPNGCSDILDYSECHAMVTKIGPEPNPCASNKYTYKCVESKYGNDLPRTCEEIKYGKCHGTILKDLSGKNTAICTYMDLTLGCESAYTKSTIPIDDTGIPMLGTCKPTSSEKTKEAFNLICEFAKWAGNDSWTFNNHKICDGSNIIADNTILEEIMSNICQNAEKTSFVANDELSSLKRISNKSDCSKVGPEIKIGGMKIIKSVYLPKGICTL